MNSWLSNIVGVVFLSILFDLIYPSGKTNKFCKSLFGIIAVGVIISPILKIDFSVSADYVDEKIVESISSARAEVYASNVENYLSSEGIVGANVEVKYTLSENDFKLKLIYVDASNIVLTEDLTNINKYEVIARKVSENFDVSIEEVFVYG